MSQGSDGQHRRRNPFGVDGFFTRAAEHVPLISNGVQQLHRLTGHEEALQRARQSNPLGQHGSLTKVAELIPGVNNIVQELHRQAGHQEALDRARRHNPIGADGYVAEVAEFIPGVNNIVQGLHKVSGKQEQLMRARERNPLGTDGFLTKAAEKIPVVADGVRVLHKLRGETEAEERARAYSIQKLVGKDGALLKVAELLPGSNLVAAALLEVRGHHEEAEDALDLGKNWREFGGADGALAKVAEMLPGVDIIAFGLHFKAGHFAQALRAIVKTRWVDITADPLTVLLLTSAVCDLAVLELRAQNLEISPKSSSLVGGVVDLCLNLLEVDKVGEHRRRRRSRKNSEHNMLREQLQEKLRRKSSELLAGCVEGLLDAVPGLLQSGLGTLHTLLADYRKSSFLMRCLLPEALPPPSAELAEVLQDSVSQLSLNHGIVQQVHLVQARAATDVQRHSPVVAAAVSCFSFLGCIGLGTPTGVVGCFAGCIAGIGQVGLLFRRRVPPAVNVQNQEAWAGFTASSPSAKSSSSSHQRQTVAGATVELPARQCERLWEHTGRYVLDEALGRRVSGCFVAALAQILRMVLSWTVDGKSARALPLSFNIEVPEQEVDTGNLLLKIPSFNLLLTLGVDLDPRRPVLSHLRASATDAALDQVLQAIRKQLLVLDLRSLDPRLGGFTEPVRLQFETALSWNLPDQPRIQLHNLKLRLDLPS